MEPRQNNNSSSSCSWVRRDCIGKGSFGKVHVAVNRSNNQVFAVKSVNTKTALSSHIEALENEIQILQSLSSPYVIGYLGNDFTHESRTEVCRNLHMEFMFNGTVSDSVHLNEKIVRSYTRCIVSALNYIHLKGIVHCDVKGKNVLVTSKLGVCKLADFGSAQKVEEQGKEIKAQGTPLWMAPEVIRQEKQGPESDIWSLGCTVIEMITGKSAWKDCESSIVLKIGFSDEVPEFPAQLSDSGRDFLDKCLRREPGERWNCEQLLQHPFLSEDMVVESSPRSILDWASSEFCDENEEEDEEEYRISSSSDDVISSAKGRINELASGRGVIWESDGWEVIRSCSVSNRGGEAETSGEIRIGTNSEYSNIITLGQQLWLLLLWLQSWGELSVWV
ncbi:hypothetical protein IFM89_026607 [Coptis chinensis]|uniref:Protein kinase domain-containing protein n=1 Tax=Coptis chinensis TaxID=261450 RepID=A0A835HK30_9MAGN|nr:hypothetical protein IFM89_026607 [Coptis chinensis]